MVAGHLALNAQAMACVAEFGRGNFDAPLEAFPGKKAFINQTVEKVRSSLKGFIAEMSRMSREHDAGDIDVVIDASRFDGDFRVMAQGVNEMVQGHITVKKKTMACLAELAGATSTPPSTAFPARKPSSTRRWSRCAPT